MQNSAHIVVGKYPDWMIPEVAKAMSSVKKSAE